MKIVEENKKMPLVKVQESLEKWIKELRNRFERSAKKPLSSDIPCLKGIVSGITLINMAVGIAVLTQETAQRCWLLKPSSSSATLRREALPHGALPALPGEDGFYSLSAPADAGSSYSGVTKDPIKRAMEESGLEGTTGLEIVAEIIIEENACENEVQDESSRLSGQSAVDKALKQGVVRLEVRCLLVETGFRGNLPSLLFHLLKSRNQRRIKIV